MNKKEIEIAAQIIQKGGTVAFPTETVYGLGANALNPKAVARIFELKERPSFDPLIVHISDISDIYKLAKNPNEKIIQLAKAFWPGPLTIVLEKNDIVPDIVTSGLNTVGIRMPDNIIALELIKQSDCPIAAPSANKFGQLSPTTAAHVEKQLIGVDYILDGGATTVGIESTIVSVEDDLCVILRPGKITLEDIENALPGVFKYSENNSDKLIAPGLLKSHYSPSKPLFIIDNINQTFKENTGLILHKEIEYSGNAKIYYTSNNGNMLEVASNLFKALHTMQEDETISNIYIQSVNEVGLGIAIMDRVKKAAYQYQK